MPEFATCSYSEFRPEMGVPVRTSNGFPRFRLRYPLVHSMPLTFPHWAWMQLPHDEFVQRYVDMLDGVGIDAIRKQAAAVRRAAGVIGVPLVLLCFERLSKPGAVCHRSTLAAWIASKLSEPVPELGSLPQPETRAAEQALQQGLF